MLYIAVFCIFFVALMVRWRKERLPPGPYSVPILGSIGFFRQFKYKRHHLLTELVAKYGNIFCIRAGQQLVVFLNGNELIREAFVKQADIFCNRPNWLASLQQGLSVGKGLIWQDGPRAARVRKFAHQTLREFGVGKTSLEQKILHEVEGITEVLRHRSAEPIVLKPLMLKASTNIIHDIVFGERFNYDDKKLDEVTDLLEKFFKGGLFLPKNFLPKFICKLLPKDEKLYKEKQLVISTLRKYIYKYISEHEEVFDEADIKDFTDLYIKASRQQEITGSGGELSLGDIFRTILDLFLAGSETTAATLEWCFLLMVKYPKVQEKCFQEIQKLMTETGSRTTCFAHRKQLPFVEATLMEVQRIATIAPLGVPHVNRQRTEIGGYVIPENTIVFGNLYSCLMDSKVWENPTMFIPERHLNHQGHVTRNESNIPFSIGSRMCLGENMAKMELFVVFTNIIRMFEFQRGDQLDVNVNTVKMDSPVHSSQNFQVVVKDRYCSTRE